MNLHKIKASVRGDNFQVLNPYDKRTNNANKYNNNNNDNFINSEERFEEQK
jgi:hypothetical protein